MKWRQGKRKKKKRVFEGFMGEGTPITEDQLDISKQEYVFSFSFRRTVEGHKKRPHFPSLVYVYKVSSGTGLARALVI